MLYILFKSDPFVPNAIANISDLEWNHINKERRENVH